MLCSTSCSYCSPEGFVVDVDVDAVAYVDLGVDIDNDVNVDLGFGSGNGFYLCARKQWSDRKTHKNKKECILMKK